MDGGWKKATLIYTEKSVQRGDMKDSLIILTSDHLVSFWPGIQIVALAENSDNTGLEKPFGPLPGL